MKKVILKQLASLNVGVIGELQIGDVVLQAIEGKDALEPGTYRIFSTPNGYRVGKDYPISMSANCRYRNKGLVLGMRWDLKRFDVAQKGEALQTLSNEIGSEGATLVVVREGVEMKEPEVEVADKLAEQSKDLKATKALLEKARAELKLAKEQVGAIQKAIGTLEAE